jgi:hypothetical protein
MKEDATRSGGYMTPMKDPYRKRQATHADVLAAIDKALADPLLERGEGDVGWSYDWAEERNAHCDDLRATAERHATAFEYRRPDIKRVPHCTEDAKDWPCPEMQQVIDRLTGWGVL